MRASQVTNASSPWRGFVSAVVPAVRPARNHPFASRSVQRALLTARGNRVHSLAAVRALKSSLSATTGGKGPETRTQNDALSQATEGHLKPMNPDDISWTAAYPLVVNWLLLYFGDEAVVREHWPTLKLYVDAQRREMARQSPSSPV